jgi:hypothetical protein
MTLLEPKSITISNQKGESKTFILSKFPAVAGRNIITQYPVTAMPKVGDYPANEALMLKMMCYVAVDVGGGNQMILDTQDKVNNAASDWETLAKLEMAMMEYNCSFFGNGGASTFFEVIAKKLQALITQMPINSSPQSSRKAGPRSKNSGQSTP